ncbi:N-acetyl-gamma-glutamyl-phosphate reductase [Dinghuibacter silviterrae]|uniref:N-acetyl-gamma-glutamyl-phosphate reductase n=1 Tax=Dinghuibacter silviterrae TaxID=1539049 RepID=A0A4R8DRB3_9BACT|nr:N-acetyl-gamma-glutamyl-phosphate reductase [Dinghuibacter silviterrae]TDW99670.1 N-acetyl-gamma-glutamyl-phosphate reductase [Dinghuibacter silviterrae]
MSSGAQARGGAAPIRVGIVGGAGYTGGELIRILLRHPHVTLTAIHSRSNAGQPLYKVHTDLLGDTDLVFTDVLPTEVDVLFLCMGHGESKKFMEATPPAPQVRIIDLSQDYRLDEKGVRALIGGKPIVYGLPEYQREAIKKAAHVANPGCFATAIQLGLLPLAKEGWLEEAYTTGITGSTGAGQSLQATTQFSWRADNVSAYKTLTHQHLREVRQTLKALNPLVEPPVHFVPWRGNFTRGIFVSSTVTCAAPLKDIQEAYRRYYEGHPFTHVSSEPIDLKQVIQTNKCLIQLEQAGDKLVVHSAIDNLLKGASGQAVQNMNLMFGLEEKAGLDLKAGSF